MRRALPLPGILSLNPHSHYIRWAHNSGTYPHFTLEESGAAEGTSPTCPRSHSECNGGTGTSAWVPRISLTVPSFT